MGASSPGAGPNHVDAWSTTRSMAQATTTHSGPSRTITSANWKAKGRPDTHSSTPSHHSATMTRE